MRVMFFAAALLVATTAFPAVTRQVVVSGLSTPMFVTAPPGDTNRLFVALRGGTIRIIDLNTNTVMSTPFLNVNSSPNTNVDTNGEGGLLSMAFHPNYASNGYFFVYYTTSLAGTGYTSRVSRFSVTANANVADPATETVFFELDQPFSNHNGGTIAFRPDDPEHYLYLGLGDGGSGCDPGLRAQNLSNKLGKMLRMDVDPGPSGDLENPFAPPSNPFVGVSGDDLIWSIGFRNPFRWSFDRVTGDMFIGDVGEVTIEEIDFEQAGGSGGLNFGWNAREGTTLADCFPRSPTQSGMIDPITEYDHDGSSAAVTGGHIYRGQLYNSLYGRYFFADFETGQVWSCVRVGNGVTSLQEHTNVLNPGGANIVAFGEDARGELYIVEFGGTVARITDPASTPVDADADGLYDIYETDTGVYVSPTNTGTDPADSDSDNDGLLDGAEVNTHQTNPLAADSDQDGLNDGAEVNTHATNPTQEDSDGDGFIDSLEIADVTNPNNPGSNLPRLNAYVEIGADAPRMGTQANPAGTLGRAAAILQPGGVVHFVNSGNLDESVTVNKAMTIRADAGVVRVGQP